MNKKEDKSPCHCKNCCKQIPRSAALNPEGEEYVKYFCSEDCYNKFHARKKPAEEK